MYVLDITDLKSTEDYDNNTDLYSTNEYDNYTHSCTNNKNNIGIVLPTISLTIPCGHHFRFIEFDSI